MMVSILKFSISQNTNCDNLVDFPKSGHVCDCYYKQIIVITNPCFQLLQCIIISFYEFMKT